MTGSDGARVLTLEHDVSKWSTLKLHHAQALSYKLLESYDSFISSGGIKFVTNIDPTGQQVRIFAKFQEQPPVEEWSLLFGDIIHNYRSSLDGLTWALAHLEGRTPDEKYARRIYFPFAKSETDWEKLKITSLSSIPEFVLDRLERVQPFKFAEVENAVGLLLNQLDIEDKHKSMLSISIIAADKTTFAARYQFRDPRTKGLKFGPPESGSWKWLATESALQDNDPIAEFTSEFPLAAYEIVRLPLSLRAELPGESSRSMSAFELLQLIDAQVASTFQIVFNGDPYPEQVLLMERNKVQMGQLDDAAW